MNRVTGALSALDPRKAERLEALWEKQNQVRWGFRREVVGVDGTKQTVCAGDAVDTVRVNTELTTVATGLYRLIDREYSPMRIQRHHPWPGYKQNHKHKGVPLSRWRKAVRGNCFESGLLDELYVDLLARANQVYDSSQINGAIAVFPWIQAPIDTLAALYTPWRLMEEITLHPVEVERDLEAVTAFTVAFVKWFHRCFPQLNATALDNIVWMPRGVSLWEDQLAIFSQLLPPGFYQRFARPYNQQIAIECGGIALHTCGAIAPHVLQALGGYDGLLAFQHDASETPSCGVFDALGHLPVVFVPRYSFIGISKGHEPNVDIESPFDYIDHLMEVWRAKPRCGNLFLSIPLTIADLRRPCGYQDSNGDAVTFATVAAVYQALRDWGFSYH